MMKPSIATAPQRARWACWSPLIAQWPAARAPPPPPAAATAASA
jgi:hypothetical protein